MGFLMAIQPFLSILPLSVSHLLVILFFVGQQEDASPVKGNPYGFSSATDPPELVQNGSLLGLVLESTP